MPPSRMMALRMRIARQRRTPIGATDDEEADGIGEEKAYNSATDADTDAEKGEATAEEAAEE